MGFRCLLELFCHCAGSSGNVVRALRAGLFVRSALISNQARFDATLQADHLPDQNRTLVR